MAFDPTTDYITREEQYLTVMAGNSDITYPEPITREEHYLAAMCDPDNNTAPDPITRREHYLSAIVQKISEGGGGGGGSQIPYLTLTIVNNTGSSVSDNSLFSYVGGFSFVADNGLTIRGGETGFLNGSTNANSTKEILFVYGFTSYFEIDKPNNYTISGLDNITLDSGDNWDDYYLADSTKSSAMTITIDA